IDITRPLEKDTDLRLLTDRDPEALEVYRHSSAHLLAAAVLELFPETKLGHGPPTDTGFFYDFYRPTPFTPEDLQKIEKKMQELVQQDIPYAREFLPRNEGLEVQRRRRLHEVPLHRTVHQARRKDFDLQDRQIPRLLPRTAHSIDREDQGVQAPEHRGRLLAGR